MSPMQERLEELAALYAAGAASASERAELEALAAQDPGVRELMRGYTDAAALLALDLVPLAPPAGALDAVRRRIVAGAGGSGGGLPGALPPGRMPGPGADVIPLATRRRGPAIAAAVVLPLAAAAAFAFFWYQEREQVQVMVERTVVIEREVANERRVRTRAEEEAERLRRELGELQGALAKVSTPQLKLATVTGDKGVVVKILLDPLTGNWYVLAFQLPDVAPDKDYQLWFLDKKTGKPVASDLFRPGPSGSLHALTTVPSGVEPFGAAISLEPKGGSPTGAPTQVIMGGEML
jgi:anti-sigma-K factor RskA